MRVSVEPASSFQGDVTPPPDKSISHRALIFSSLAEGRSIISNLLRAGDTLSTMNALRALGVRITDDGADVVVEGQGLSGLREPERVIDCGNSGTTMRLLSGVLAGSPFFSVLAGDTSLSRRPMGRVIRPLTLMGASFMARGGDAYPPMAIRGGGLRGVRYEMPVASAQVKSALLLAGLQADGETEVVEPVRSRDHTERMLPSYGARLTVEGPHVTVQPGARLRGRDIQVPNDFSSAAFFIAAAIVVEGADVTVRSVGLNPTRTGLLDVLERMGAAVEVLNEREVSGEPVADLRCRSAALRAVEVEPDMVPSLIDEFPVLCVIAAYARGVTVIRGAGELRVKESDRIRAMAEGLTRLGIRVEETDDSLSITGGTLRGAEVESFGDHRVAMALAVAGLGAEGATTIHGAEVTDISFPGFYDALRGMGR